MDLKIVEDAAQAHGAAWESGPVGSLGDAAGFSFQSSKNLSCGEGGVLTTNDEQLFERAYSMHNAGRSRTGGGRWEHVTLGWNIRPTEYQAALAPASLQVLRAAPSGIRLRNFELLRSLDGRRCLSGALGDTPRRPCSWNVYVRHALQAGSLRWTRSR